MEKKIGFSDLFYDFPAAGNRKKINYNEKRKKNISGADLEWATA